MERPFQIVVKTEKFSKDRPYYLSAKYGESEQQAGFIQMSAEELVRTAAAIIDFLKQLNSSDENTKSHSLNEGPRSKALDSSDEKEVIDTLMGGSV